MKATSFCSSISANLGTSGEAIHKYSTNWQKYLWLPHFRTFCELFSTMLGCVCICADYVIVGSWGQRSIVTFANAYNSCVDLQWLLECQTLSPQPLLRRCGLEVRLLEGSTASPLPPPTKLPSNTHCKSWERILCGLRGARLLECRVRVSLQVSNGDRYVCAGTDIRWRHNTCSRHTRY